MDLATLLRETRIAAGMSQLDLSLRLEVSQRHVSFLELGRARPSRALLVAWMDQTGAAASVRNAALLLGGFSSTGETLEEAECGPREAARLLLCLHEPYPAICCDANWHVVMANPARRKMNAAVMPDLPERLQRCDPGTDLLEVLTHPSGLLAHLRQAAQVGWAILRQLRAEMWANPSLRERVDRFAEFLEARHPLPAAAPLRPANATHLALEFETARGMLAFHAVQTLAGLPQNITPWSLRTTLWYPVNDSARQMLLQGEERWSAPR
ncbi:MAG TPA: helix-turn-helix domain-containing protein [Burkholderiaceae bacterium]|nr:helix-turn-helix domain-containing protein [Burkholderiaceae bacterium]